MRNVVARQGKARLTMQILKGEDFYLIEMAKPQWSMKLRAHELCGTLARCEKALGSDPSRYMLHGPFLHQLEGLKIIGADSSRIHLIDLDDPMLEGELPVRTPDIMPGIIIPPKTVKEILRIFAGDESEITLSGNDRLMAIEAERIRLASKLIDATYVDYPRMMPKTAEARMLVPADKLLRALDGLLVVPKNDPKGKRETVRGVRLTMRDGAVDLYARGDTGEAEDTVEATNEGVPDGTAITFAAHFLKEAIDAAGSKQIAIHPPAEFGHPFRVEGGEGAAFIIGQRRL
jgi:DNA polymerase-3 subunit beta